MRAIELFPCAGGMGLGFKRAGIVFDLAFDFSADACASYEANLEHRPIQIDVRDLLRMMRAGASLGRIDLLVADPPCTPWSRAGKRKGLDDEHDMLRETCELIALLRPTCWLIGNVPGLDDSTNDDAVATTIGALSKHYDVDYAKLNASSYGIVQSCPLHAIECPTSDAEFAELASRSATARASVEVTATTPNCVSRAIADAAIVVGHCASKIRAALASTATEEERWLALQRLAQEEKRTRNGPEAAEWTNVAMSAFAVDETIVASIGSWLSDCWDDLFEQRKLCTISTETPQTTIHRIWKCIAATVITGPRIGTAPRSVACGLCLDDGVPQHRVRPFWFGRPKNSEPIRWPAPTHGAPGNLALPGCELLPWVTCRDALQHLPLEELGRPVRVKWKRDTDHKLSHADEPGITQTRNANGDGALLALTDDLPTAKRKRPFHNPHPPSEADKPARGLTTTPRAGHGGGAAVLMAHANHPPSTPNEPARTVTSSDGGGVKGHTLTWPWDVPATTVTADDRLPPPGHHPESGSIMSQPNAVVLSEKARAILQGFPPEWRFLGDTKRSRSSMIGMAMPPPMAEAVARSIVRWFAAWNALCDCGHSADDHGAEAAFSALRASCATCSCCRFEPRMERRESP